MAGREVSEEDVLRIERATGDRRRPDGLTPEEGVVMDGLIDAVEAFGRLDREHPSELVDFVEGIHRCQWLLALRLARRTHPEGWPRKT